MKIYMEYRFYRKGKIENIKPINTEYKGINNPYDLYDALTNIWCEYSCAPRMRPEWSKENMTLGQCSITSFLVQDIFGGEVYGVLLPDGAYHCFNKVGDMEFDLTSEQFQGEKLTYTLEYPQSRKEHFSSEEKYQRYLYLCKQLKINK